MNKWEIKTVEGKPTKFGTGAHITLPKEWLKKTVVVVSKEQWEETVRGRDEAKKSEMS